MTNGKKLNVAVVSDRFLPFPLRHALEAMAEACHVWACVHDADGALGNGRSSLSFRVFEAIPDMPGYMRGIEDELAEADVILADDPSRLATFQAVRAALKHRVPVAVHSAEVDFGRFRDFPNVRAIQADVLAHADLFLCAHEGARAALMAEGVPAERLRLVGLGVPVSEPWRPEALRRKFRDYVRVAPQETLVAYHYDDGTMDKAAELIQALRLVRTQHPAEGQKLRLLFLGGADAASDLKYRAFDHGLSRQVMFLHQDPAPFQKDLHAALDAMVMPRVAGSPFPAMTRLLEAMADGVIPVVPEGSWAADVFGACALVYRDDSMAGPSAFLLQLMALAATPAREEKARDVRHFVHASCDAAALGRALHGMLAGLCQARREAGSEQAFKDVLAAAEEALRQGHWQDASMAVEDLKLRTRPSQARELGRLMGLQGQIALQRQAYDEAVAAFSDSVAYDAQHWASYLGLAQVSFLSHAHEEARRFYRKVLSLAPGNPHATLGLGMVCRRLEEIEEAMAWFRECLKADPAQSRALAAFIQCALEAMDVEDAIAHLEDLRDLVGEAPNLMRALGQLYIRQGQVELGNSLIASANSEAPMPGDGDRESA